MPRNKRKAKLVNWPIGTKVRMVNCVEAEKYGNKIWVTRSEPWVLPCGAELVLLEGRSGGFDISCLKEML